MKKREYHGYAYKGARAPEYRIWSNIKQRCTNPKNPHWEYYGGRPASLGGPVVMCSGWSQSFAKFFEDMGSRPAAKHSLDRIDNLLGYVCGDCSQCALRGDPRNVRWASLSEQARNKRNTIRVEFRGEVKSLYDWCDELGVDYRRTMRRLNEGWSPEEALTRPCQTSTNSRPEKQKIASLYHNIIARCHRPSSGGFHRYGAKGIAVCSRWRKGFAYFYEDMWPRPSQGFSVDRINGTGGYWCGKPECDECGPLGREANCRWADHKTQAANRKPPSRTRSTEIKATFVEGRDAAEAGLVAKRYNEQRKQAVLERGERLKAAYLSGVSQNELAELEGMTQANIGTCLRRVLRAGEKPYTKREVAKLANVPYRTLVEWEERGGVVPGGIVGTKQIRGYQRAAVDTWIAAGVPEMRVRGTRHRDLPDDVFIGSFRRLQSWERVAEELGIPVNTVYRVVRRRNLRVLLTSGPEPIETPSNGP